MTTILFDLDGTLIDTTPIVLPTFREVIGRFGMAIPSDDVLKSTFGHPDTRIWEMLMPSATPEIRREGFLLAERRICERMFEEDLLLAHAKEVLDTLFHRGYTLSTASNCGEEYLNAVLDSQRIREYFTHPLCLESVHGAKKAEILAEHFRRFDKSDCFMVGDRSSDVEAAREHGVPTIGCAFGFGPEEELQGAQTIIRSLMELIDMFPEDGLPHLVPHGRR